MLSEKRLHLTEDRGGREDLVEFEDLTDPADPDGSSTSLASTSKHKQGKYDPEWEAEFPWVQMIVAVCTADFASVSTRGTSETEPLLSTQGCYQEARWEFNAQGSCTVGV